MIRILHYIPGFLYGGIESLFLEWYKNIDQTKYRFDLLKRIDDQDSLILEQYRNLGGMVYQLEPLTFRNINGFRMSVRDFFRQHRDYDILHMHGPDLFVMRYAKKFGISKIIVHSHTSRMDKGIKPLINYINEQMDIMLYADAFFACSQKAAEWKFKGVKGNNRKVRIIHNSIRWDKYLYNEEVRDDVRKNWDIEDKFVVGVVGRMTQAKNPYGIFEIFSMVKKKRGNACLFWVGDGPESSLIKKKMDESGLLDSVIFAGYRGDIAELMQAMDVFVFPSLWEGLGLAALEAQAAGLKTVCSENVPKEVDVSPLCKHIPLDDMESWVMEICESEHNKREDTSRYFMDSVYDISFGIQELEKSYKEVLQNSM